MILFEFAAVIVCHRKKIYRQTHTQTLFGKRLFFKMCIRDRTPRLNAIQALEMCAKATELCRTTLYLRKWFYFSVLFLVTSIRRVVGGHILISSSYSTICSNIFLRPLEHLFYLSFINQRFTVYRKSCLLVAHYWCSIRSRAYDAKHRSSILFRRESLYIFSSGIL